MHPTVTRVYQNHHLDNTRWDAFTPRDDDIIITTSYKSGTTWMQEIVLHLVHLGREIPYRQEASPWLDARFRPLEEVLSVLADQQHRRFIKSHLAADGLPNYPQVKYIVVGRDPRDVFMSLWNHYTGHKPDFFDFINGLPDRVGDPFPPPLADIHELWRDWITRGWFEWEHEGYPYWGNMHHIQSWWNVCARGNILLVHFADLLAQTDSEIRRIADFLMIPASDEQISQVAQATTLTAMRTRAEENNPGMGKIWQDGARTFFYKGTNGRWRDVLTPDELTLYEATAAKVLTPDCRAWLERA
jgi:aryl sulfotransferase